MNGSGTILLPARRYRSAVLGLVAQDAEHDTWVVKFGQTTGAIHVIPTPPGTSGLPDAGAPDVRVPLATGAGLLVAGSAMIAWRGRREDAPEPGRGRRPDVPAPATPPRPAPAGRPIGLAGQGVAAGRERPWGFEPMNQMTKARSADASPGPVPGWVVATATAGTVFIAVGAFWLSFTSLSDLAARAGIGTGQSWMWPLIVDGIIVVAAISVVALAPHGRRATWYPWALHVAGALVSVSANIAHAAVAADASVPRLLAAAVSAVPPATHARTWVATGRKTPRGRWRPARARTIT